MNPQTTATTTKTGEQIQVEYWTAYARAARMIESLGANHQARWSAPAEYTRREINAMNRFSDELAAVNVGYEQ